MADKFGTLSSSKKKFHPDEPLFPLRATDPLAATTVMLYHALAVMAGCSKEFLAEIVERAKVIENWQIAHPTLVKARPD